MVISYGDQSCRLLDWTGNGPDGYIYTADLTQLILPHILYKNYYK